MFTICINVFAHTTSYTESEVFVTQEMIDRDRQAIQNMINEGQASLNAYSMRRSTTKKKLSVPHLYQDKGSWANKATPCGHFIFKDAGCAATSYTMMSRYYGNSTETPPTFCTKYQNKNGTCICNQTADGAAKVVGKTAIAGASPTKNEIYNICVNAIDKKKTVIIRTNKWGSHYVIAYGYYITSSGNPTIYIHDPESDYDATTLGTYFNSGAIVREYAVI